MNCLKAGAKFKFTNVSEVMPLGSKSRVRVFPPGFQVAEGISHYVSVESDLKKKSCFRTGLLPSLTFCEFLNAL